MWINRVATTTLMARVDCEFYEPSVYVQLAKLSTWKPRELIEFVADIRSEPPIHTDHYASNGIHIISPTNFTDFFLDLSNTKKLGEQFRNSFSDFQLESGRILFALVGDVGHACVVPNPAPDAISYRRTANLRLSGIDPYFVCSFLNTNIGACQLSRMATGVIQAQVRLEDSATVLVPSVEASTQKYIGNKVRQAERLRAFANSLAVDLIERFSLREHIQVCRTSKNHQCTTRNLVSERLDAPFYLPEHIELQKALQSESAVPLGTYCQLVAERWKKRETEFLYFEIGSLDVGSGRITPTKTKTRDAASRAQRLLKPWDVLVSTVRPNRKNVGLVTQADTKGLPLVASTGFAVLRFQDRETAAFFHSWLRSDVATQQLVQRNAGGSYPAIEEEVVPRILVQAFSADTIREIGGKCIAGMQARDLSANLCDAAKLLVEALIERNFTEDDLIYAQTQLEQGDDAADRAILNRLYDDGWDATDSRSLFPDLDAYYETLRMIERKPTEVAAK